MSEAENNLSLQSKSEWLFIKCLSHWDFIITFALVKNEVTLIFRCCAGFCYCIENEKAKVLPKLFKEEEERVPGGHRNLKYEVNISFLFFIFADKRYHILLVYDNYSAADIPKVKIMRHSIAFLYSK